MDDKEFVYIYPYSKEHLFAKLNERNGTTLYWNDREYLIEIKNDNLFFLGIKRIGHSGGYWYIANIEENSYGGLTIRGKIAFDPDENGNSQEHKTTVWDKIEMALLYVLLFPLVIVIWLLRMLISIIKHTPFEVTKEDNLDKFMLDFLCCNKKL